LQAVSVAPAQLPRLLPLHLLFSFVPLPLGQDHPDLSSSILSTFQALSDIHSGFSFLSQKGKGRRVITKKKEFQGNWSQGNIFLYLSLSVGGGEKGKRLWWKLSCIS